MEQKPHQSSATPEEIWNILRELSASQRELSAIQKETDKLLRKSIKDLKESMKDTDRRLKKTDALFNSPWDKLVDSLVEGDLVSLLRAQGIAVEATTTRVNGRRNGEYYVYDILAVNDGEVVVVVVKTTLQSQDMADFLEKLGRFTSYRREYRGWKVYGAVAYLKADHAVVLYAARQGLFVIRATGSSASIVNEDGFQPRVFT